MVEVIPQKSEHFGVSGMTCASCAISLETHLKNQKGIETVSVNYPNQSVALSYDPELVSVDILQKKAKEIGYEIITGDAREQHLALEETEAQRLSELRKKLIFATVLSIPVFIMAMFFMGKIPYENWIMMILSAPVLFWSGG